ncbi:queuosine precursor transporter [Vibrio hepatarius]|uniref:queuosine precursor transporter n=1 Tax=Vibrio hepatarius TaxID=171383 RepID=UPI001C090E1A|nr:queuosine precursor transporter [Vibrio hepatarius]MBU2898166.1 queuosine precursor transporter [Vibrio hepatarius]
MKRLETSTMAATLGIFCFLTASNLAAAKSIEVFGIYLTAGFFTYPFVYFFSSIIIATRSPKTFFKCITMAYIGYLVFISLMYMSTIIPGIKAESNYNQSLNSVYSLVNYRVYLSSLCAYFVSMSMFGVLFTALKIRNMALRITLSTFFVALVDVKLFLVLAFFGVKENNLLLNIIVWSSAVKLVAQLILLLPAIWTINMIRDKDEFCFSN